MGVLTCTLAACVRTYMYSSPPCDPAGVYEYVRGSAQVWFAGSMWNKPSWIRSWSIKGVISQDDGFEAQGPRQTTPEAIHAYLAQLVRCGNCTALYLVNLDT